MSEEKTGAPIITRRNIFKGALGALGAAAGLSEPGRTERPQEEAVIRYEGTILAELQGIIDSSNEKDLKVVLVNDIKGDGKQTQELNQIPVGDDERKDGKSKFSVGLYLKSREGQQRSISITSADEKKPVSITSNSNFGIYADGVNLTLENLTIQGGISKEDIPDRFEQAHVFVQDGILTAKKLEIRGEKDKIGKAGNGVDKGLTGIYVLDSKASIEDCALLNCTWDAVTTSGSDAVITDTSIYGFSQVEAGAGIGIIRHGRVDIDRLNMTDRIKGVLCIGEPDVSIKDSYIKCSSSDLADWYAVVAPDKGSLTIEGSVIVCTGNIIKSFNKNTKLTNNTLIYDRPPGLFNSLRFFDASILMPNSRESFTKNKIYATNGTPGWEIIAFWEETDVEDEFQAIDRDSAIGVAIGYGNEYSGMFGRMRDEVMQKAAIDLQARKRQASGK